MPKKTIISILALLWTFNIQAQIEEETFHYGFSTGINWSSIGELQTTLIRPIFPESTYNVKDKKGLGIHLGAFVYYRFKESKFAIEPTVSYSALKSGFHYNDVEDLQYDIDFNYAYLQIAPLFKFYTAQGIHLTFGPQLGLITNPSRLKYTSSKPELGPDLQIQQSLREVLKGNHMVSVLVGVGYDTPFGLGLNLRYSLGISDAIETLANGFYFIENNNPSSNLALSISYAIPFYK